MKSNTKSRVNTSPTTVRRILLILLSTLENLANNSKSQKNKDNRSTLHHGGKKETKIQTITLCNFSTLKE